MKHLKSFNEMIKIPIKVGDTVLGGRFKNKKVVVKKIGKNDKGDITINGKPLLKYRIVKESYGKLREDVLDYLVHLKDNGFEIEVGSSRSYHSNKDNKFYVRVWLPNGVPGEGPLADRLDYNYKRAGEFTWSQVEDEIDRFVSMSLDSYKIEHSYVVRDSVDGSTFMRDELTLDELFNLPSNFKMKSLLISLEIDIEKSNESVSIFDDNWTKLLPQELNIITHNGEFNLKVKGLDTEHGYPGIYNLMNSISFIYDQNTVESEDNDVTADGEPDNLQFDIAMVKDNDGSDANPKNSLRLNIDLTYGDSMMYSFTIDYPNRVHVHHYNGKDSLYDPETHFGFTDESLQELITFFNRFGFTTDAKDFTFIDSDLDSYDYERNHPQIGYKVPVKVDRLEPMIMNDEEKVEVDALKGGDKITKYSQFKSNK